MWEVANLRVYGTTHESVAARWNVDRLSLQPLDGQQPYPYVDEELGEVMLSGFGRMTRLLAAQNTAASYRGLRVAGIRPKKTNRPSGS